MRKLKIAASAASFLLLAAATTWAAASEPSGATSGLGCQPSVSTAVPQP